MTCQLLHRTFRGLHSVHLFYGLQTCQVASATLYTEGSGSFVASTAASIATGWSDPVPGWDLHPLLTSAFHGAHATSSKALSAERIMWAIIQT